MKIHYFSYYAEDGMGRDCVRSTVSKVNYMFSALETLGEEVSVVSTAKAHPGSGFQKMVKSEKVYYLPALGLKGRLGERVSALYMKLMLFCYLVKNVAREDVVVYYHSIGYFRPLRIAKRIRKFSLVMEFNDKYSFHYTDEQKIKKVDQIEREMISDADAFILASPKMRALTGDERPSVVNYGSYDVAEDVEHRPGSTVQLLYSGVIDEKRKAAELAIDAMAYLPDDYQLHVAGFGNQDYLDKVVKKMDELNKGRNHPAVIFHGFLNAQELKSLMQKCDIALSTHSYEDVHMSDLCFPAKIPMNMASGLYMVSQSLPVIVESPFAKAMCFYKAPSPKAIAEAIQERAKRNQLNPEPSLPRKIVQDLDREFKTSLRELIRILSGAKKR